MRRNAAASLVVLVGILLSSGPHSVSSATGVFYISPNGSDSNSGSSTSVPFKTFAKAFSVLPAGGTLYLLDGTYTSTNGSINQDMGAPSGVPTDGVSATQLTTVMALNEGSVVLRGSGGEDIYLGTIGTTKRFLKFQGFTVTNGVNIYHGDHISFKNMGVTSASGGNGVFAIGSNDNNGQMVSSYITLEDNWIWGNARKAFAPLNSDHIILRRVVLRNDGCRSSSDYCGSDSGNYMSGSTVYNSSQVSMQNVLAIDNVRGPAGFAGGADFWTAWHTNAGSHRFGANEWIGSMSINSEFSGFVTDTDAVSGVINPAVLYKDDVVWNAGGFGFNAQCGGCSDQQAVLMNLTAYGSGGGDLFNIHYATSSSATNLVAMGSGRYGYFGVVTPSYVDNTVQPAYNGPSCQVGCKTTNPLSDGSIRYIARIEAGSPLKGTGSGGADYGANVVTRYGADGTFHGDGNFNTLTSTPLWPWPNENRVNKEMCVDSGVTRGFCSAASLTSYVWTYLGNPNPYTGSATPPLAPTNLRIIP